MARGHHSGPAGGVGSITVLQNQPESGKALELLYKIHSLVKPIMTKHGWYLPTLAEFYPKQDNLLGLNVNGGEKILIRLRPAGDPRSFYPLEESLIGTMLHELTHNVRGPHDETFNKILDGLENEYDALRALGYSGEGFLSNGTRIGHGVSHNLSPAEARALAVKKVKERDRVARILGKGGVLGGKKALGDPREVRARAAERRMRLQKGCGGHGGGKAGLSQEEELEVKRAAEDGKVITIRDSEDEGDVVGKALGKMANGRGLAGPVASTSTIPQLTIPRPTKPKDTITLSSDDDNVPPTSTKPRSSAPPKKRPLPTWAAGRAPKPATATLPSVRLAPPAPPPTWPCPACTFANPLTAIRTCQACLEPRPGPGKLTRAPASASGGGGGGRGGLGPGLVEAGLSMGMGAVKDDSIAGRVARGEGTLDLGERGWWCDRCGRVNNHQFWTCVQCGTVKTTSERG